MQPTSQVHSGISAGEFEVVTKVLLKIEVLLDVTVCSGL